MAQTTPKPSPAGKTAGPTDFPDRATIGAIDIAALPLLRDPTSTSDDVRIPHSPLVYASGAENNAWGVLMQIGDVTSIYGHLSKAATHDFCLSKEIPLPDEVGDRIAFVSADGPK